MIVRTLSFLALVAALAEPANCLCIYKGVDNAKTTMQQEFHDSRWVVRARVLSAQDHEPDQGEAWTKYRLKVVRDYKGTLPSTFTFFTYHDSGGFYMDRPWVALPKGHDVGGQYLLFLIPWPRHRGDPAASEGATFVDYSCGQSRPWSDVDSSSRRILHQFARRH